MKCHESQYREVSRRKSRNSKTSKVLKNVVSLRVTDKEKKVLEKITRSSSRSVSEVVREAIVFWIRRQRSCRQS